MEFKDIVQVASGEIVEIKPEYFDSDPEDSIEQLQLLQRSPEKTCTSHISVDIKDIGTNLASFEAKEIKLEYINSDSKEPLEHYQKFTLKTERSLKLPCIPIEESHLGLSETVEIKLEDVHSDPEYKIEQQLQPVCIDLKKESDHEEEEVPISQTGDYDQIITKSVIVTRPVKIITINDEAKATVSVNEKKYYLDQAVHDDEFIMKPVGYSCAYCSYYSSLWLHLKHHIKFKHRDPDIKNKKPTPSTPQQCPFCPKRSMHIDQHISSCHSEFKDIDWVQCDQCNFKTKTKHLLDKHIETRHTTLKDDCELRICEECGKWYKGLIKLNIHRRSKHRVKPLKCSSCDFTTKTEYAFNKHRLLHNNPEKAFKCKKCDFSAQHFNELLNHKTQQHPNRKRCHLCAYRAKKHEQLRLHLLHHQEKKIEENLAFRCTECNYKTCNRHSLQSHMIKHKKPYEIDLFYCYHCDFRTKRKGNLRNHIFKHDIYKKVEMNK